MDNGVHTFSKSICPKMKAVARLEFELVSYDFIVQQVSHKDSTTTIFDCEV